MKRLKVLVACEESQAVTIELRKLGHIAFSCDILECSGGHNEWHTQQDVTTLLNGNCSFKTMDGIPHTIDKWDMIIAFPPCTYMTAAGACRMYPQKGIIDQERLKKCLQAREFFMTILNSNCDHIAIENPRQLKVANLPKHTQEIQPWQFGHPYTKATRLWLKNLPKLETLVKGKPDNTRSYVSAGSKKANGERRENIGEKSTARERSKTFKGIAQEMALQWSNYLLKED